MRTTGTRGFYLLELVTVVTVIFILAALTLPYLITQVYAIRIRYSATELSGLLQATRMESVRLNTYCSVQGVQAANGNPALEQVVDKTRLPVNDIPQAVMASNVSVFYGPG